VTRLALLPVVLLAGAPAMASSLDKEVIRRPIRVAMPKITRCYENQLAVNPKLEGRVTVQFTIASTGKVIEATATGVDDTLAACVAGVIRTLQFPRARSGTIRVSYPFEFRP
jgi:outer membrane biosynthesis protein TonB